MSKFLKLLLLGTNANHVLLINIGRYSKFESAYKIALMRAVRSGYFKCFYIKGIKWYQYGGSNDTIFALALPLLLCVVVA